MLTAQNSTCTFCGANFTKQKAKFCGKCGKPRNSPSNVSKEGVQPIHESHKGFTSSTQNVAAAEREISVTTTPPAIAAAVETNITTSPNKVTSSIKNSQEKQQSITITNTNTNTNASETQLPNVNINRSNIHNKVVDKVEPSSQTREEVKSNNNNINNNNMVDESNPFSTIKDSAALQIITPLMLETTNADELRS